MSESTIKSANHTLMQFLIFMLQSEIATPEQVATHLNISKNAALNLINQFCDKVAYGEYKLSAEALDYIRQIRNAAHGKLPTPPAPISKFPVLHAIYADGAFTVQSEAPQNAGKRARIAQIVDGQKYWVKVYGRPLEVDIHSNNSPLRVAVREYIQSNRPDGHGE